MTQAHPNDQSLWKLRLYFHFPNDCSRSVPGVNVEHEASQPWHMDMVCFANHPMTQTRAKTLPFESPASKHGFVSWACGYRRITDGSVDMLTSKLQDQKF